METTTRRGRFRREVPLRFRQLDTDGSGRLDEGEVAVLLENPAVAGCLRGRSPQDLIREMDRNNDGEVDLSSK